MGRRSRLSCDCGSGFEFRGAAEAFDVDAELAEGGEGGVVPGFFGADKVFETFAKIAFGFVPGEEFDAGVDGLIELRIGEGLRVIEEAFCLEGAGDRGWGFGVNGDDRGGSGCDGIGGRGLIARLKIFIGVRWRRRGCREFRTA